MNVARKAPISKALFLSAAAVACLLTATAAQAQTDTPLIYVPLAQPCRLLDTRVAGPGPLTQAYGIYQFYTDDTHIESAAQNGSATGCGIPAGITAISANFNMINTTASGNIRSWSDDQGTTGPSAGDGVYDPHVLYNTGYSTIDVGADGGFYLDVANGQIDMTINVVGYWRPIGWGVTASGLFSTAIGDRTTAIGGGSTAMGALTTASGIISTAMGGYTMASGNLSTAMGFNAKATEDLSFVWAGDGDNTHTLTSPSVGSFTVYAPGGVYMYSGAYGSGGCVMSNPGSAGWTCSSDRALKTNIVPVDARAVLDQVVGMPVAVWSFKTGPQYRHIGPMAQDFKTAFDLGDENDKSISTSDAQGVALAAIQGLNAKLQDKESEIAALRARITSQESALAAQKTEQAAQAEDKDVAIATLRTELAAQKAEAATQKIRVAALESLADDLAEVKAQLAALRRPAQVADTFAVVTHP